MTSTVKDSTTLNVVLLDALGSKNTFRLNNPLSSVTLAQVTSAFNAFFASSNMASRNLLVNGSGVALVSFERAEIVETVTTTTVLE